MKADIKSQGNDKLILNYLLPISTVLVLLGGVQAWIETFYLNNPFIQRIGWVSQDGAWPKQFAFGVHYFGDYLLMNQLAQSADPWAQANSYPPLSLAVFKFFSFFPYKLSLFLWILFAVACFAAPIIHATRRFDLNNRIQIIAIMVFGAAPVIGTLDRGNCIFILVPLFYFGYQALQKNGYIFAGFCFGAAAAIKLYPLLIIVFLIILKKWKIVLYSLINFVTLTFASALIWTRPLHSITETIKAANAYNGLDPSGQPMVFSFAGLFHNLLVFLHLNNNGFSKYLVLNSRTFGIILFAFMILISFGASQINLFLLAISTIQFIPTVSYTYTRIWTVVAMSLLVCGQQEKPAKTKSNGQIQFLWWVLIIGTDSLLTIHTFRPMSLGPEIGMFCLLAILAKSFNFDAIKLGFKSLLNDFTHIFRIERNSPKTKRLNTKS